MPMQLLLPRLKEGALIFVPMKVLPSIRNFFLLKIHEVANFSLEQGKFATHKVQGELELHRGEHTTLLEEFHGTTAKDVLDQAEKRLKEHYLKMKS